MAGYAVTARVERVEPRLAAWSRAREPLASDRWVSDDRHGPAPSSDTLPSDEYVVDLVGQGFDRTLADWIAGIRESWSQTMFFLLDPDSWR
jgi:hypothetical protein